MSRGPSSRVSVGRSAPTVGRPTATVALVVGYGLVSLVLDPLATVSGPHHVLVRPSAGLPVLFGVAFGPLGVVGAIGGVVLEAAFAGGGLVYSLAVAVGTGTVAAVAWLCWEIGDTDEPDGASGVGRSLVVCTLAAATVGNAAFAALAVGAGGYPFAPLAVEGMLGTTLSTLGLAVLVVALERAEVVADPFDLERGRPTTGTVGRGLGVTTVGLAWIAVATGVDTAMHDLLLLPPAVVEQHLPHGVVGLVEYAIHTWWVGVLLQFCIALVAVAAIGRRFPFDGAATGASDGPTSRDESPDDGPPTERPEP